MYKTNTTLPAPLSGLTGLAKAIALPHEHAPQRFPSFPALERTAVMGFSVPTNWVTGSGTTSNKFMLARQAVYPLWGDIMTTSSWAYSITYAPAFAGNVTAETTFGPNVQFPTIGNVTASLEQVGISGTNSSLVTTPVMGFDQGTGPSPWIYAPINSSITIYLGTVTQNSNANGSSAYLSLQIWTAPGEYTTRSVGITKQTVTTNYGEGYATTNPPALVTSSAATGGIWIRPALYEVTDATRMITVKGATIVVSSFIAGPAFTWSNAQQGTMTVSGSANNPVHLPLVIAPEINTSPLPWQACRTTAASVLLTNTTQVLNKAGTFLGGRISPAVTNPFLVPRSYIANLHPAEKQQLCAEEGFYTYSPPSTDLANFWDHTPVIGPTYPGSIDVTTAMPPFYRLDNDALVNIVYFDDSVAANFSVTVDWHIEFRTSSALWQIAVSTMPLETLHSAQLLLHGVGYFFSNKWHLTLMKILSHLKAVSPVLGIAHTMGKMLISNKPQRNAKPTSFPGRGRTQSRRPRGKPKRGKPRSAPPPRPAPRPNNSRPKLKSGLDMYLASRK